MATQTLEQFGQTIKQKYPQYNDIPDAELGQKMLVKYPQYKDMVDTSTPTTTKAPTSNYKELPLESNVRNAPTDIKNAFTGGIDQIKSGYEESKNAKNPWEFVEGGIKTAAGAVNTIFSPLAPITAPIGSGLNKVADKISDIPAVQKFAVSPLGQATARTAENVGNVATITGGVAGGMEVIPKIKDFATQGFNTFKNAQDVKATNKIQDTISPKITPKEVKIAVKDGRFVDGQDPTLLRGGTKDTIIPSDKTIQTAQTIKDTIPNADKLKPSELYTKLDDKVSEISQKLKPEMEQTPIKPQTVEKITSDWETLKKTQSKNPYLSRDVNVKALQEDFESRLQQSKAGNMNDLWETRKAYDSSVPDSVKKSNSLSSQSLQDQKEIWLQNRDILNGAINDVKNGLGATSQKAFSDMSDMYNGKENILSKAKIKVGAPSKVRQWVKDNPWKAGAIGYGIAKITGADKALKAVTGVTIP